MSLTRTSRKRGSVDNGEKQGMSARENEQEAGGAEQRAEGMDGAPRGVNDVELCRGH